MAIGVYFISLYFALQNIDLIQESYPSLCGIAFKGKTANLTKNERRIGENTFLNHLFSVINLLLIDFRTAHAPLLK